MRTPIMFMTMTLLGGAILGAPAWGQHHPTRGVGHPSANSAPGQHTYTEGEVKVIDRENRKVTLRHGEIPNIDMPPMTMPFLVPDQKVLDHLKPGDKVKFRAINDAGKFTLTELIPLR